MSYIPFLLADILYTIFVFVLGYIGGKYSNK